MPFSNEKAVIFSSDDAERHNDRNIQLNQGSFPIGREPFIRKENGDRLTNENIKLIKEHKYQKMREWESLDIAICINKCVLNEGDEKRRGGKTRKAVIRRRSIDNSSKSQGRE